MTFLYSDERVHIISFPIYPLDCNASVIICKKTKEAAVVDPGGDIPDLLSVIDENNATLSWVLFTHAHFDHSMSTGVIAEERKGTIRNIALHADDLKNYENAFRMAEQFGFTLHHDGKLPGINHWLSDGDTIHVGEIEIRVIHTPGHSAGSVCFYMEKYGILIAGDTLFQGSVGRTDLLGGSFEALSSSIRDKLYCLPDDTVVITGHGPVTTIGKEKKTNAFVRAS